MNGLAEHKAVAIDSVNFCMTYRSLGVAEINHQNLLGSLRHNVGSNLPIQCRSTIHSQLHAKKSHLFCDMKRAGIEIFPALSHTSDDDCLVKDWIHYFGNKINIHELIVITCDHDIIEEALCFTEFARKHGKTLQVYIVATATRDQYGDSSICEQTLSAIEKCTCAHFVELKGLVKTFARSGRYH